MLHSMAIRLIHVDHLETLYLFCKVNCQPGVIWGHRGSNCDFHKKCNNLFMLHSMTIRLTHVHQLKTLSTYVVGLYFNLGSFGVTGVKRSFSLKMQ